nr:hypothetical protein [Tanacetum cinerariifolium]
MLFRDRRAHAYTRHLMEIEARLSREAWVRSMDTSNLARGEVMSLRTTILGQTTEIRELHAADRRRQIVTLEVLRADHRRFVEIRGLRTADRTRQQQLIQTLTVMQSLQRQVTPLQGQDRPKVTLPPRKRLGIALGPGYEVGESSSAVARPAGGLRADYGFVATMDREIRRDPERQVGYGITDSWDEIVETFQGATVSTDTELGGYMREFETRVRDRRAHAYTRHLMEIEARLSREAWVRSMDTSNLARGEVMSLRTTILGQTKRLGSYMPLIAGDRL